MNRRAREHTAVTRVQSFARQRLAVIAADRARELEQEHARQLMGEAAVRLQSTARRRLAVNTARRFKDEEARALKGKQDKAAGQIQGFWTRKQKSVHDRKVERKQATERDEAATKLQCFARRHEAKTEARRRYAQYEEAERKKNEQANVAAARIQTFTRKRMREEGRTMIKAGNGHKAAVTIESVVSQRDANMEMERRKSKLSLEKDAACILVERVQCYVLKRHESVIKVQKLVRVRAQRKLNFMTEAREQNAAARRLQALGRQRLAANERRRALEYKLATAKKRLARTIEKEERAARKVQRFARESNLRKRAQSLRQSDAAVVTAKSWEVESSVAAGKNR